MSIYVGDKKVSGNAKVSYFPLFTPQWQDHITNDASWLRSDTFSWQSGAVYVSAYQHLVADISGITSETETISGTTITFYRATDGHKIVLADQESNVSAIYTATGVAWYYILDTTNTRFKLPISKWSFVGSRNGVGDYVEESLPNITGSISGAGYIGGASSGALKITDQSGAYGGSGGGRFGLEEFDASLSSSVYQNDASVQQRATQMYLYFYVGNTVVNETLVDVSELTEELTDKADTDLANLSNGLANTICTTTPTTVSTATSARPAVIVENYVNGTSWYRVWSDGWCEQGGLQAGSGAAIPTSVTLLKEMADTNYTVIAFAKYKFAWCCDATDVAKSTTQFSVYTVDIGGNGYSRDIYWRVSGHIA